MEAIAHIFTPEDNSLEARVKAYKQVLQDYRNVQSAMGLMDNKEWGNRLGEPEEVQQAYQIIERSLLMAIDDVGLSRGAARAKRQKLLTAEEALELGELSEVLRNKAQEQQASKAKEKNKPATL